MVTQEQIGKEFGKVMNLMKRRFAEVTSQEFEIETCGNEACTYTPKQGMIIGYINKATQEGRDVFQKDIEKEFSIRRSTATGILQLMEKNEFIKRVSVENDARLKKIVLTNKAIQMDKKIVSGFGAISDLAFKDISEEELEGLMNIIQKVKKNLEDK